MANVNERSNQRVSAIICTRDRSESLGRALLSFLNLDLAQLFFELIIVDNGLADETKDVVRWYAERANFPIRYRRETRRGLSNARNAGLELASGEIIVFTDDDCFVSRDWVQTAVRLLSNDPLQVIGGRVDLYDPNHLDICVKASPIPETASKETIFEVLMGANMALSRHVIRKIGGFDVRLGAGTPLKSAEDTEFAYRAFVNGIPVRYAPALRVTHNHGRTAVKQASKLYKGYAIGDGAILMLYLLKGRTDLIRPVYWSLASAWRDRRKHFLGSSLFLLRLFVFQGALRFLLQESWRGNGYDKLNSPKELRQLQFMA